MHYITIIPASSLEKTFLDAAPPAHMGGSMLRNELFSFQFAFSAAPSSSGMYSNTVSARFRVESPIRPFLSLGLTGHVPVVMPTYPRFDQDYLRTAPGLFPDPILPIEEGEISLYMGKWRSLWISIHGSETLAPGEYPVALILSDERDREMARAVFTVRVIDALLPAQAFPCTNWLHFDCIADAHAAPMFSEDFWRYLEQYVRMAVAGGTNLLLTPCFTPPLDTPVGEERMTAQLIDVTRTQEGSWQFGFARLDRFIDLALAAGEVFFEHSHLFTQWGAKHAPKIMAMQGGTLRRVFGWDTDAHGAEYTAFLDAYLSALMAHLDSRGLSNRFYFHVSDEPLLSQMPDYLLGREVLLRHVPSERIIDAISEVEFLERGALDVPVAAIDRIGDFLGKTDQLWAYYTGGQSFLFSNRLISMPQRRNRVLGMQLYRADIKGFLQWGFSFYYNRLSRRYADPFRSTDGLGDFAGGTSFLVYPGDEGPLPSLRYFAFSEAMTDLRALGLLESLIGREETITLIESMAGSITFESCPCSNELFLDIREAINRAIEAHT